MSVISPTKLTLMKPYPKNIVGAFDDSVVFPGLGKENLNEEE